MARHRSVNKRKMDQLDPSLPPSQELKPCEGCLVVRPPVRKPNPDGSFPPAPKCLTIDDPSKCPIKNFLINNNVEIEIGPGMGRFIMAHAKNNPEKVILGIEKETVRVAFVDTEARRRGIENIRLVGGEALPFIQECIPNSSISGIYIFFPDPWPKKKHHKNRLFKQDFINAVFNALSCGGVLNAATDHEEYFSQMVELMSSDNRFKKIETFTRPDDEKTDFELRFEAKGLKVHAASWQKI